MIYSFFLTYCIYHRFLTITIFIVIVTKKPYGELSIKYCIVWELHTIQYNTSFGFVSLI